MTTSPDARPPASAALLQLSADAVEEPKPVLRVRCKKCRHPAAVVHRTSWGLLWVGYRRNSLARSMRTADGPLLEPIWLEGGHFLSGECRCMRDTGITAPGWPAQVNVAHTLNTSALLEATRSGRRVVEVTFAQTA